MNIREFLQQIETDEKTVMARFANNEGMYLRFAKKFLEDPSYTRTREAIAQKDYKQLEAQAHTLKGVAANLGFDRLSEESAKIVNAVRESRFDDIGALISGFEAEYQRITEAIGKLD